VQVFIDCNNIWVFSSTRTHHDAQKSTIVTFQTLLRETTFPSGLGAAKSEVHFVSTGAGSATKGLISKFCLDFPAFVFKDSG
jgi:hypothetical protein